jgi:hypothetical protein
MKDKLFWFVIAPMMIIMVTLLMTYIFIAFFNEPVRQTTIIDQTFNESVELQVVVVTTLFSLFIGFAVCSIFKKLRRYAPGFALSIGIMAWIAFIIFVIRAIMQYI